MDIDKLIAKTAEDSAAAIRDTLAGQSAEIYSAASMIEKAIREGGKVLVCGNGGSAADSQHLAGELIGRFLINREAYPAVSLTTDTSVLTCLSNDFGFDTIFERQVAGLGRPGDVLVGISTSGNSPNVVRALDKAAELGMKRIALTGAGGGAMANKADVLIAASTNSTPRVQEAHAVIIHLICEIVEGSLSGG